MPITQTNQQSALTAIILALILLGMGVLLGAFGAHALPATPLIVMGQLDIAKALHWWQTATLYWLIHSLGVLIFAVLRFLGLSNYKPVVLLCVGLVLFCGSLYAMALGASRFFGVLTPIGGLCFVVGWLVGAWQIYRQRRLIAQQPNT